MKRENRNGFPLTIRGNDKVQLPAHIGIIMDGNGRWAQQRKLPRILGHQAGIKAVRRTILAAQKAGVRCVTLYSFSTENWKRPKAEVQFLFELIEKALREEIEALRGSSIRIRFIGRREELPAVLQRTMRETETATRKNTGLTLVFAINHGGRQEILDAVNKLLSARAGKSAITERVFRTFLQTADLPDPDVIIRTSGEQRLSNFLIWEACYAEFFFLDVLWPDFSQADFDGVLRQYARRKRRFGGIKPSAR